MAGGGESEKHCGLQTGSFETGSQAFSYTTRPWAQTPGPFLKLLQTACVSRFAHGVLSAGRHVFGGNVSPLTPSLHRVLSPLSLCLLSLAFCLPLCLPLLLFHHLSFFHFPFFGLSLSFSILCYFYPALLHPLYLRQKKVPRVELSIEQPDVFDRL